MAYHVSTPEDVIFTQIDALTQGVRNDNNNAETLKEITRNHWKPVDACTACFSRTCRKKFTSLLDRPHHCRRCGEAFCADCLKYKRRLNLLARLDPEGALYKVCKNCFELGTLTDGQTRTHTSNFVRLRKWYKEEAVALENGKTSSFCRNQLNFDRECQRLLKGFKDSVGNSEIKRTLHEMRSIVSTPLWQKSSQWIKENLVSYCQFCQEDFSLLKKKTFCRLCGVTMCKPCSSEDLLLYIPDEERGKGATYEAKMCIIKFVGCPVKEPEVCLYLRVCKYCKTRVIDRTSQKDEDEVHSVLPGADFMDNLGRVHGRFVGAEQRVQELLPKYQEVVESLEDSTRKTNTQSNIKILAKAQEDLADSLAQHVTVVQQMKQLKPVTNTQATLLKTYIRAKCEFYLEHMSQFRGLKHKLSESVPAEGLDTIQRIMDKNAIISTHLYLRQLVYETIHLCDSYAMEDVIPKFLMDVELQIESDVKASLHQDREDVEEHMAILMEMIRTRLKANKLIRPSKNKIKAKGSQHIYELMNVRTETILNQVNFQLQLASANRSFVKTKDSLEEALRKLKAHRDKESGDMKDFVFVDKS